MLLPIAVATGEAEWVRAAGTVLSLGALAFGLSIGHILGHLTRVVKVEPAPDQAHAR